jgi:hemerythrin superfamily protein
LIALAMYVSWWRPGPDAARSARFRRNPNPTGRVASLLGLERYQEEKTMAGQSTPQPDSSKSTERNAKAKSGARASRKTTRTAAKSDDAIKILKNDHKEVRSWFDEFEKTDDDNKKEQLARNICKALSLHAQIEEEIFYAAARAADVDDDLLDEAEIEHESAKHLIEQIVQMRPKDPLFDAKVTVLGEYVKHHVEEEEKRLFAACREREMDLKALGLQLAERKAELTEKS